MLPIHIIYIKIIYNSADVNIIGAPQKMRNNYGAIQLSVFANIVPCKVIAVNLLCFLFLSFLCFFPSCFV